ncbi:MAG: DUF1553 domain-containing protein, partial [Acidobacteria bacterium]|nr:DUF1553 domain-containing protein [Acidobacteriota bacterium]
MGRAQQAISFQKDVLPILTNNCLKCHGEAMQLSGLDLRSRAGMLKGGQHGPAIQPGNAEGSALYRRVAGTLKPSMPFDGKLGETQVTVLRDWINQGAGWEGAEMAAAVAGASAAAGIEETPVTEEAREYWAFRKPVRPPVPRVKNAAWARHPIDAFLMQVFEQKGLTPAPPADRAALARRAYLDLIGLAPTPEQVAQFVNDRSPDAWEKLIERLLASPNYGERWGRYWLDVARYADSSGFEHDRDRPAAWRYRDYVIDSFNKDTPYNIFIAEELAGDELDWSTYETKTATGFLRAGPRVDYREKDNPQYRYDYLDDMIATTSQGFLGLTVQCARCHNHKFDPIPQKDYYRLQAVFFPYVDVNHYQAPEAEVEALLAKQEEIDSKIKPLKEQIAEIEAPYREKVFIEEVVKQFPQDAQIAARTPEARRTPGQKLLAEQLFRAVGVSAGAVDKAISAADKDKREALAAQIKELEKQRPKMPPFAAGITDGDYRFAPDGYGDEPAPGKGVKRDPSLQGTFLHKGSGPYKPPPSYFLFRGEIDNRGPQMAPGFISVITNGQPTTAIPPADERTSGRRRALAEWIGSPDNPLTARVMVNRIWHHHFGRGIVATLNNFGKMGERPSHPELLDWLATEFVARGWSVKQMHRLMMTSDAYKMSSQFENAANQKSDPENNLFWKFRMRRMDAEALRDSILAVSGKLNRQIGGPPVFPKVDRSVLATMKLGIWEIEEDGPKVWRRSVYIYRKRGMPFPLLEVFDLPDQNVSCPARNISTVPTQALTLLNDEFVLRQARFLAERVAAEAGPAPAEQLARVYQVALGRDPSGEEKRLGLE